MFAFLKIKNKILWMNILMKFALHTYVEAYSSGLSFAALAGRKM
jgi:hypothetical protein